MGMQPHASWVQGICDQGLLNRSKKENSKTNRTPTSSSKWATSFLNVASNVRASAEAEVAKLTSEFGQAWQTTRDGVGQSSSSGSKVGQVEECPQCHAKFSFPGR